MVLVTACNRGVGLALMLGVLALNGCFPESPPQVPIAPNASLITARVLAVQSAPGEASQRLSLEILTAEPLRSGTLSLIRPGEILWALTSTKAELPPAILGQTLRATARVVGDERGQRVWLGDIEVLSP